jgi:protein TonB
MAHVFLDHDFGSGIAARRTGASRRRLALALTVSLFLHMSLGMGRALELPRLLYPTDAFRFTARLQQLSVDPEREAKRVQNVASPEANAVRTPPYPTSVTPPAAADAISGKQRRRGAAIASIRTVDAPELALPSPQSVETYYTVLDLDVYPSLRAPLELEYPERAARARVSGRVLVMLALDATGSVDDVSIVKGEPQGYFEDTVRSTLGVTRFFPAQKNGSAVKSRILLNVEFGPASADVRR